MLRSEAVIDLAAISDNVATVAAGTPAEVLGVVKADAYGHGLVPSARAALRGGATWLGTALVTEAVALRAAGITAPILAWLWTPPETETIADAVEAGIELTASNRWQLAALGAAARTAGRPARVHLKIDTGLSRNGSTAADWADLVAAAARAQASGELQITGVWSHFACADEPEHPANAAQLAAYRDALAIAERVGLRPEVRHLANSAAILTRPEAHFDLVRLGIGMYGLPPVPGFDDRFRPAMTLRAALASVKRVPAGSGVSYGHTYHTASDTTLALVPLGYADGIPRNASNRAPVQIGGRRLRLSGRVCMDQFVVDVGDLEVAVGDSALLFGPGDHGEPTARDWARVLDTIDYELVTRIGPRVVRSYIGGDASPHHAPGTLAAAAAGVRE